VTTTQQLCCIIKQFEFYKEPPLLCSMLQTNHSIRREMPSHHSFPGFRFTSPEANHILSLRDNWFNTIHFYIQYSSFKSSPHPSNSDELLRQFARRVSICWIDVRCKKRVDQAAIPTLKFDVQYSSIDI
jgi:hypothetical protein